MRWRHAASCTWMYRHGRPDVVCVVSSEFLFLLPPFFAAPTVFLSHPRPFFPRFFLSLFRSPITYLRSSGAQLPLAAPRLHAFDTINDPSSARDRRWNHLSFRFSGKKNEVAPTPTKARRLEKRTDTKAVVGKKGGGEAKGRIDRIRSEFSKKFICSHNGVAFQQGQINFPTLPFLSPLHRSTLTFIGSRARRQSLSSSSHPCVTVDSVKSSLGMISKRDPLPFLCYAIGRRLARLLSETISAITRRQFHAFNISNFSILYFSSIRMEYDPIAD